MGWTASVLLMACSAKELPKSQTPPPPAVVLTHLSNSGKTLYLTFDLCGGPGGDRFDTNLAGFLEQERIPASIFLTEIWARSNQAALRRLTANSNFRLENHGSRHRCVSSNGIGVYGLPATQNPAEIAEELDGASHLISRETGRSPRWFRPAGLGIDAMGLEAVRARGMGTAGCAVAFDEGATAGVDRMARIAGTAKGGDIILTHLNHPEKPVAKGFSRAWSNWVRQGFTFAALP